MNPNGIIEELRFEPIDMDGNYFTGSFDSLFSYWQDDNRAKKFVKGGTRTGAIQYLLNRAEPEIHQGLWIDTAVGAGYVQDALFPTVEPSMLVGIDFSRAMLDLVPEPVERILASYFQLPIRKSSASLTTNIFSLSDYPDPSPVFREMQRVTRAPGIVMFLDYSNQDQYWVTRQAAHGSEVVGNINLRDTESIVRYLPPEMRVVENIIVYDEVSTKDFDNRVELPDTITRAFLFVELYNPRS